MGESSFNKHVSNNNNIPFPSAIVDSHPKHRILSMLIMYQVSSDQNCRIFGNFKICFRWISVMRFCLNTVTHNEFPFTIDHIAIVIFFNRFGSFHSIRIYEMQYQLKSLPSALICGLKFGFIIRSATSILVSACSTIQTYIAI